MSELRNGPFSGFTGRTGQLVGYRKNGKWVMAAKAAVTPGPPTPKQINERIRFGIFPSWLSWIAEFIEIGFQAYAKNMSPMNAAVKYNMDNALTGVGPNFTINFPKVLLSRGRLAQANEAVVAAATPAQLDLSWKPAVGTALADPTDQAVFIVYNQDRDVFLQDIGSATRADLEYEMAVPAEFSGEVVQVYMAFLKADHKKVSTSQYVAQVTIL